MKLYNHDFSPNAKRVRVATREVGVTPEMVQLDFAKGDHKAPAYVAKNPSGKIPTFEDTDGTVVWESPAILIYLAEKHADKGLLPKDLVARSEAFRWMFWNASHMEPSAFPVAFERVIKPAMMKQEPDEAKCEIAMKDVNRYLPILNGHLEGKDWILGKTFSVADICLGTTLEFMTMARIDLAPYKHIGAWLGRLQARDSWKKG